MSRSLLPSWKFVRVLIPRGERAKWLLVVGLGVLLAFTESIAALSIAVLIDTITQADTSPIQLPLIGDVSVWLPGETERTKLQILAIGMAIFFLLKGGLALVKTYTQARVAENTGARIASRLFQGYLTMPYRFHLSHNSAELIRNASWATDEVMSSFLRPIANILTQVSMLVFLVGVLVMVAPGTTLITLSVLLPVTLVMLRLVKPSLNRLGKTTKRAVQETLKSLQQSLHGIRDVKVLGRERFFADAYRATRYDLARPKYLYPALAEIPPLAIETLLIVFILALVAFGGGMSGAASLPVLGLFAYAGLRMMPATSALVAAVNRIRYGQSVAETLSNDLQMVDSGGDPRVDGAAPALQFKESIRLQHVSFAYERDLQVLTDVNLVIRRGETIGIVGETGAGKSTLLDLILGLLTPQEGQVTVDGEELTGRLRNWHAAIGLVPQSIYLLDDTVRRNIAYGVRDEDIDDGAIAEAVDLARLRSFINSLPMGLETVVGDRGIRLSGGQRQRVAIARALYRKPQVLFLDEGTASLDNITEAEFMKAIEGLRGELTIIIVAHRLTTVRNCDRIVLMSDGEIVDEGGYEELRSRNMQFRKMTG